MNKFALCISKMCLFVLLVLTARAQANNFGDDASHIDALLHSKSSEAVSRLRNIRLENEQSGKSCNSELAARIIPTSCYRVLSEAKTFSTATDLNGLSLKLLDKRCRLTTHSLYNADILRQALLERSISLDCRRALSDRISELDYMKIK